MPAKEWTMPAQKKYLMSKLTAYMAATDISNHKALHHFWVTLNEGWYELFPVQTTTNLVAIGDEIENTKEVTARRCHAAGTGPSSGGGDRSRSSIGAALAGSSSGSRGGRASKTRSLFSIRKRTKEICPYRPIEVYQKVYNLKIPQEVMAQGYSLLNEETETAAAAAAAAAEKETEAVEAHIHKKSLVADKYAAEGSNRVSIGEVIGWYLCLLVGGPMPNCAGAISMKTICYGTTALGSDFQALHPSFDDSVKAHFNKFLKWAFSHKVHDARGIIDNSQEIAGAIAIDNEGGDETPAVGEASKPKPPKCATPKYGALADIPFGWDGAGLDLGGVTVQHATFDVAGEDRLRDLMLLCLCWIGVYQDTSAHAGDSLGLNIDLCRIISDRSWLPATAPSSSPFGNAQSTKLPVGTVPQPTPVLMNTRPPSSLLNAPVVPLPTLLSTSTRPPVPSRALVFFSSSLERHSQPRSSSAAPPTPPTPPSSLIASTPSQSFLEGEAAAPPGPHYIVLRPMANPPKAPAPARSRPRGRPQGRGRGRGHKQGVSRNNVAALESAPPVDENSALMSTAAQEESARIHREEAAQWKDRAELHKQEKAMEEKEAVSKAAANHRHNPSGGADLVVVERPKHAVKAALNLDGTPVIRPVQRTWAELAGSWVAIGVINSNVQQAKADAELLKQLNGKGKGKGKAEEAPAPKTRPTKLSRVCRRARM
ncbi:hypothetical protein B0H14DRAFT_2655083 [Mycena olivaceomarginata]|nr:hypothetical protein B0H14DRAFT_2655083 [Mycena olivaceomarginata]